MQLTFHKQVSRDIISELIHAAPSIPQMGDYELQEDSEQVFAVTIKVDGKIMGGATACINRAWVYVDAIWVDHSQRGKGIGARVMQAIEHYGATQQALGVYLYTSEFQATPFYAKVGYRVIGEHANRPAGYTATYYAKTDLQVMDLPEDIKIENPVQEETFARIGGGLVKDALDIAPVIAFDHALMLHNEDGVLCGGLYGHNFWGWFDIHLCWANHRNDIVQLLDAVETFAQEGNLIGISNLVYNEADLAFLRERGYEIFAKLANRPEGKTSYFMMKLFASPSQ